MKLHLRLDDGLETHKSRYLSQLSEALSPHVLPVRVPGVRLHGRPVTVPEYLQSHNGRCYGALEEEEINGEKSQQKQPGISGFGKQESHSGDTKGAT